MLTVLTIDDKTHKGKWGRLLSPVLSDSVRVQSVKTPFGIRHINYTNRRGKVNWKRIKRKLGNTGEKVLYSGNTPIPQSAGIELFKPLELRKRLCTNMALGVLEVMKSVPKKLRIGLYDPEGECADFTEHILKFTDNLIVVSRNYRVYREQAQFLLSETGAVLCVSPHISLLSTCGMIISPTLISTPFTPATSAVVLSISKPSVPLPCRVYYRYSFPLEKELQDIKPQGIDTETFAGGLYSICGVYSVGSVVPLVCMGEGDTHTTLSLRRYLTEFFGT